MSMMPVVRRLLTTLPSSKLSAPRVRDVVSEKTVFPDKLVESIKSHYKDISYVKQQLLSKSLSKNTSTTVYATPPIPPAHKIRSKKKLQERAEIMYNQHLASKQSDLKQVDFIMYRSFPHLFYISNRMFSELKSLDKEFVPLTMLDLGNNLGATVWAIQKFYGEDLDEYVIHEHSKDEYNRTLKLFNIKYKPHIDNVSLRGAFSMPRGSNNSFDVVTAVNYFPHFQEYEFRKWFDKVWKCTGQYLVIADIANRYTSLRMSRIRSYFLKRYGKEGHILAPCPHAHQCPMLKKNDSHVCRFAMKNVTTLSPKKLLTEDKGELTHQKTEYTYLILKRGMKQSKPNCARLLGPVIHHDKRRGRDVVEFQTCNSDGTLWRAKTSFEKSEILYNHVAKLRSGDLVDQDWWNHDFSPLSVFWTSKDIEEQVEKRRVHNKSKFSHQLDRAVEGAEEYLAHVDPGFDIEQEKYYDYQPDTSLDDDELYVSDDHLESMSLLSSTEDI